MDTRKLFVACLICLIILVFNFQLVLAHEEITIGDYTLAIGWLSEPPIAGQQNAIIVNVAGADGQPVEDVSGLTVTVSYGGQDKALTLQPLGEDTPGQFVAPILPTIPGQYTIKLGGILEDTAADAEVEPEEVESVDTLQFPSVAAANESTSAGMTNWLVYVSLLIGLVALVLAVMALQKKS